MRFDRFGESLTIRASGQEQSIVNCLPRYDKLGDAVVVELRIR